MDDNFDDLHPWAQRLTRSRVGRWCLLALVHISLPLALLWGIRMGIGEGYHSWARERSEMRRRLDRSARP